MKRTRKITAAALMIAVSVLLVLLANTAPTSKLALLAASGIASALIVTESGPLYGLAVWAVTSAITIITVPVCGIIYCIFFGWYPSLKCVIERMNKRIPEWILKTASFSISFCISELLFVDVLNTVFPKFTGFTFVLYAAGCAGFILYDICLSMIISYYLREIYPKIRK